MPLGTVTAILVIATVLVGCGLADRMAPAPEGARYRCNDFAFDPTLVDLPGGAEPDGDDPRALTLQEHLRQPGEPESLPDAGWHLVGFDANRAEYVAKSNDGYASVTLELRDGAWTVAGWGGCDPELVLPGDARAATWDLAPDAPVPNRVSTSITVLVSERSCASGQPPGDRIVGPQIVTEPAVIRIAFGVRPLPGGQDCQGSPPGRVLVDLGQPIGDRLISDFGIWPPINIWGP